MSGTPHRFERLHHVQVSMPPEQEETARAFYSGVLGMTEVEKPPALARRGGAWFRANGVELHLGVEQDFRPAKKAHPAFVVDDLQRLADHLTAHGTAPRWDGDFPGHSRFYADDPFGNRLEFLQPLPDDDNPQAS
ncbi:VOC family protein [Streptomyces canus]|uniref:VOC family protein n=1 Tax=Streptomyces canus TaxID=58343 RepID=UPI002E2988AD|nr:VOC family protein [Streptomyces canus]